MLPKIQPALSEYYSDNAEPLATRIFDSIWGQLQLEKNTKPKILDLGEAQSDSFNFYSERSCFLTIADCIEQLTQLTWLEEKDVTAQLEKSISEIIPYSNMQYDVILGWDCFNYIPEKIIAILHTHLLKFCTEKTIIHGFIFTSEYYPKDTGTFKILDSDQIQHAVKNNDVIRHTPLTPMTINKVMPNFKYTRSVLMRSGLQEFMLTTK